MIKTEKKPDIRFAGFTEVWLQHKLSDIADRVTRKNTEMQSNLPLTISSQYGLVDQITYFNNRVASQNISGYYLIKNGEFAYNKSSSDGYPFGVIKRLDRYEMGVLSTLYIVFTLKDNSVCSQFLVSYFDTNKWHREVSKRAAEGARNHGLLNISTEDFLDIKLLLPREKAEQEQIGTFFSQLDNLIALQQRKCDKLKNIKKTCLEKMFPKEGSNVPEIRFKGFTGAWEKRKLGKIVSVCSGKDYKHLSEGNIPVYGTGGYMLSVNEALSYDKDAIGIGRKGTIDNPYILRAPFWTVDTLFYAVPEQSKCLDFIYCIFQTIDWKLKDESTGVPSLSKEAINNTEVLVPNINEQLMIGRYFEKLDNLISLQQCKLEKLKNLKKAFLEKMFV